MAQFESHYNNPQTSDEFGGEDKEQTQKFIKIITTFASRVDISVCKAQLTIDVLLSQYNIPLAPKEAIVDDTSSSKIKSVMAVIRRAAILQRDVDRLGQLLISRHPQQNLFSPGSVEAPQQQYEVIQEQLDMFDADVLITPNDYVPSKQTNSLPSNDNPPPKQQPKQEISKELLKEVRNDFQRELPKDSTKVLPQQETSKQDIPKQNDHVPPNDDNLPQIQIHQPQKDEQEIEKQDEHPESLPQVDFMPIQDEQPPPIIDNDKQLDSTLPNQETQLPKQEELLPPRQDWVAGKAHSGSAFCKPERPLPVRPERALSPKMERALSPKMERVVSPKPERAFSPVREGALSPTPERALSPRSGESIPKMGDAVPKQASLPTASVRVVSPSPPPPPSRNLILPDKPSTTNVSNLKALFRDMNLYHDPRQIPPGSPKASARVSPVAAAQAKPNSSLLAKSLSTSVIPNSASPPSGGLAKQTSFSSTPPGLSKSGPPPPKQYMAAPPPPSNAAASPSPPSYLSSTPPTQPNAAPVKPMLKKAAAPPQRFQSSPSLNSDIPLRSSFDSSPTPSPPSQAASSNSFLSSTPPPSMVKAVLKSTPLKKPPAISTTASASPPSPASTPPASTPPANGTFGAKRTPHALSSSADFSEPTPLSSDGITDDSNPSEAADPDTAQSSTPPSLLNVGGEFGAVAIDDPSPEAVEPPSSGLPIADDLDGLELDDDDDDDSIYEEAPKEKVEKFDSVKIKKDINALLDEIDKEEATPAKRVNPGIKDMLSPFFTKRPKNKQEMETNLKDKGIVPREDKKKDKK